MNRLVHALLAVVFIGFGLTGCLKSNSGCENVSPQSEEAAILQYGLQNDIPLVKHETGLYYDIITPGSGGSVTATSKIYVKYVGRFLNGTTFETNTSPANPEQAWVLGGLIPGFQIGTSLIQKGGKVRAIVPSALAYGCQGIGNIPPNTVLDFEIELLDIFQ